MKINPLNIVLFLVQGFFDEEPKPIEEAFQGPSLVLWVLGWIFLSLGLVSALILVLYTKYGREISIKLSVITIVVSSILLGLSFHFLLLCFGF
ncbi:MAG: hypothetical protein GF383_13605 [Candidatus Lokiarchaeota archaeon]|nr:hypothetical protein [Candidatus Lokiarchaeota archaeon]MBD3342261.1 hypothetical protein [Candidatus Lokiarchaeota archaeon]